MISIARNQILLLVTDIRFFVLFCLVMVLFSVNAVVYSQLYDSQFADWSEEVARNNELIAESSDNLQHLSVTQQLVVNRPSPLQFIAAGGVTAIPNAFTVNAFRIEGPDLIVRDNPQLWSLPALDWSFIIGGLLSLAAIFLSFDAINGEKRDGTLKFMLAQPISRVAVFLGKLLGIITVLVMMLLVGIAVNLVLIETIGSISLDWGMFQAIGWAIVLATAFLIVVTSASLCLSSLMKRPAVSLVVLLIIWLVSMLVIPGLAQLSAHALDSVEPRHLAEKRLSDARSQFMDSLPEEAFAYPNDPHNQPDILAARSAWTEGVNSLDNEFVLDRMRQRLQHAHRIEQHASLSPIHLLSMGLSELSGAGFHGLEITLERSLAYRDQLNTFIHSADARDSDSPHAIYAWATFTDRNTFSTKPVEAGSVPRFSALWPNATAMVEEPAAPTEVLLVLTGLALALILTGFFLFVRFDPR